MLRLQQIAYLQVVISSSLNRPRNGGTNHAGPQTDRSESCGHKIKQRQTIMKMKLLRTFLVAFHGKAEYGKANGACVGNPEGKVRHSLLAWCMAKLSQN